MVRECRSRHALNTAAACLLTGLLTGCAMIFTGTKDTLRFDSEPRGAEVAIHGERVCRTPCQTSVRRSIGGREASLRLEGYEPQVFRLHTDFNYVSLANLNFLFAWAIDLATGAIIRYDRKEYRFELKPSATSLTHASDSLNTGVPLSYSSVLSGIR